MQRPFEMNILRNNFMYKTNGYGPKTVSTLGSKFILLDFSRKTSKSSNKKRIFPRKALNI